MDSVVVGPVPVDRMSECEQVVREAFDFGDRELIPGWYMHTVAQLGGVALAAQVGGAIAGYVFAAPAVERGQPCLFLTVLSVRPERRSQGVALRLLEAVRTAALERGYAIARWTTNAISSRNLYLYLARCGARIVGYRPMMYDGLLASASADGPFGDEVEIEWSLEHPASGGARLEGLAGTALTRTVGVGEGRSLAAASDDLSGGDSRYLVEVPWDAEALGELDAGLLAAWRSGIRTSMTALLDGGYEGIDVAACREERRSFVVFAPRDGAIDDLTIGQD